MAARSAEPTPQPVIEPLFDLPYPPTDTRRYLARETLKMRCSLDHDHSTQPVTAIVYNRSSRWWTPPFHCPDCSLTRPRNRKAKNWVTYKTVAEANEAGHERACWLCFPRRVIRGK